MKALFAIAPLFLLGAQDAPQQHGPVYAGHAPARFHGENVAVTVYVNNPQAHCNVTPRPGNVILGCAYTTDAGVPIIVLPNPCFFPRDEAFAMIACHELAHINGWGRNHEL